MAVCGLRGPVSVDACFLLQLTLTNCQRGLPHLSEVFPLEKRLGVHVVCTLTTHKGFFTLLNISDVWINSATEITCLGLVMI